MQLKNLPKAVQYSEDLHKLESLKAALDDCGDLESVDLLIPISIRHPSWDVHLQPVFNSRLRTLVEECIEQLHEKISKL